MIIGRVIGRTTTNSFDFLVSSDIRKFDYVQVMAQDVGYVLCQAIELSRDSDNITAKCMVIGYKDAHGSIKPLRTPIEPGTEVLLAEDSFIADVIKINGSESGAYLGNLEGKDISVYLDLKKLLTKHVAVLAKSGAGKSYTVGVLLEEIMERNVPLLIIDPHGEYSVMRFKNDKDKDALARYKIKPKGYSGQIAEYGDPSLNPDVLPLKLNESLDSQELLHLLPSKFSNNQLAVLYSALKDIGQLSLSSLMFELEKLDNTAKWGVISVIDYIRKLNIFSHDPTPMAELIQPGRCSILNFRGVDLFLQELIVYKLLKDLFEERKKDRLPPFFVVVEEAHNFVPERTYGEKKSSQILRTVASEGRKFGMGLCVISQRPARIEKNVLSQCTTQIILKVTNPNDLKAIANSVEGITLETEDEIRNLPIGTALVTGLADIPLIINIRPRKSKHGGESVDILNSLEEDKFFEKLKEFSAKEMLPVISPKISLRELMLMSEKETRKVITYLIPAVMVTVKQDGKEFSILLDLVRGDLVKDISQSITLPLSEVKSLYGCRNFEKIVYLEVQYSKKLSKKKSVKEVMQQIGKDAILGKECYIIYHKLIHKDETGRDKG